MNKEIRQAYAILKKVYDNKAYAGIELNKTLNRETFNINSKLITKIVYGVIERDIYLDYTISKFVKNKPDSSVLLLLKIGTYIIKNINSIPVFACVNEIVEIAKIETDKYAAGFVNATLKNISKKDIALPDKDKNLKQYLSVKYSYPIWLVDALLKEHNAEFVEELLSYNLTTLTHIRVLEDKIKIDEFIKLLENKQIEYQHSAFNNTLYVEYSQILKIKDLKDKYIVQGLPSIITSKNVPDTAINVLDLCASPGGKSIYIAQNNPDAIVTSCDINEGRVELIKKFANSYDVKNINILMNDATILREEWIDKFDAVICDVPCSNLGITNKKPDVLLNRNENTVSSLKDTQLAILRTAANYVKKGGTLIYSTCSIMKEENEKIVGLFLKDNKDFIVSNVETFGVQVDKFHNLVTFYPHISKCEGFFIGRLTRK